MHLCLTLLKWRGAERASESEGDPYGPRGIAFAPVHLQTAHPDFIARESPMRSRVTAIAIASILLGACNAPTAPTTVGVSQAFATATQSVAQSNAKTGGQGNCTFSRGMTTCTTTVQYQETSTHSEYSGCRYGPNGVTGSRVRTFSDVDLVTVTTTTLRRGKSDHVYSTHTDTTRQRLRSTQTSDVCQPI